MGQPVGKIDGHTTTGWWFGTCFIFPYIGNSNPNRLSYFSEGRLNHQPDNVGRLYIYVNVYSRVYSWMSEILIAWLINRGVSPTTISR